MRVPNLRIIHQHKEVIAIMLLGGLSLTWFRGHLIDQGDFGLPLYPNDYFHAALNVWDPRWSFGYSSPVQIAALPLASIAALSQLLGAPLLVFESLEFYIWFTFAGLFTYYMCRTFGLTKSVSLLAGALYMLNPFSLVIIWQVGQGILPVPYFTAPLALGVYNDYLRGAPMRKIFAIILLWFGIGGTAAFVNPSYLAIFALPILVLLASNVLAISIEGSDRQRRLKHTILRSLCLLIVFGLVNAFWMLPVFTSIGSQYALLLSGQAAFGSLLSNYGLNSANLIDSFRLLGYWALNGGAIYGPYYQWGSSFFVSPILQISFLIPLLAGAAILLRPSATKLYFAVIWLSGLVLIGGLTPPFSSVNSLLFDNISWFRVFQEAFQRFGFIASLGATPLVALGVHELYTITLGSDNLATDKESFKRLRTKGLALGLCFLFLVALVYPFWTGDVIQSPNASTLSPRIEIPNSFTSLRNFTNSLSPDSRIASFPLSNSYNVVFDWPGGGYSGSDPTIWFSSVPVMMFNQNNLTKLIQESQYVQDSSLLGKLLAIAGVKYVVYHADTNFTLLAGSRQGGLESASNEYATLKPFAVVEKYGNLSIYENPSDSYPLIYIPQRFLVGNVTTDALLGLLKLEGTNPTIGTMVCNFIVKPCYSHANVFVQTSYNGTNSVYAPESGVFEAIIQGYNPLVTLSSSILWRENGTSRDSFSYQANSSQPPGPYVDWTIDRSVGGMRGIEFATPTNILANSSAFDIWVKGDGSNNQLIFQIYDTSGNYLAFSQNIDWIGWQMRVVSLAFPSYVGGPSFFNFSGVRGMTYFYANTNEIRINSTISLGPPELQAPHSNVIDLKQGGNAINAPTRPFVILLNQRQTQNSPVISYTKTGANQYLVNVKNSSGEFPLVFNEEFDSGWKAYVGDINEVQALYSSWLPDSTHFIANTYANGWMINKTGSFQITLAYRPDAVAHTYLLVTILSTLSLSSVFAFQPRFSRIRDKTLSVIKAGIADLALKNKTC